MRLQQEAPGDYVIATGRAESVRNFCILAFEHVGLKMEGHVVIDERFLRPTEVDLLQGNSTKAKQNFGWIAETTLEQFVVEMVEADLERVRRHEQL